MLNPRNSPPKEAVIQGPASDYLLAGIGEIRLMHRVSKAARDEWHGFWDKWRELCRKDKVSLSLERTFASRRDFLLSSSTFCTRRTGGQTKEPRNHLCPM